MGWKGSRSRTGNHSAVAEWFIADRRMRRRLYRRLSHQTLLFRQLHAAGLTLLLLTAMACASAPPSREHPLVACRFDSLRRFNYALIVERIGGVTVWVMRQMRSSSPDRLDREERTDSSSAVRPGYCPDESTAIIEDRNVWRQEPDRDRQ
jgi:hypothetical protein